jgi:hypothetical protein
VRVCVRGSSGGVRSSRIAATHLGSNGKVAVVGGTFFRPCVLACSAIWSMSDTPREMRGSPCLGTRADGCLDLCLPSEHAPLGGTCVNVGCVPKKLMTYGAHFLHDVHGLSDQESRFASLPFSPATCLRGAVC